MIKSKQQKIIGACSGIYCTIMLMIQFEVVTLFRSPAGSYEIPFWARHFSVSRSLTGAYDKVSYTDSVFINSAVKASLWRLNSLISVLAIILAFGVVGLLMYGFNKDREEYRKIGAIVGASLSLVQWILLYYTINSEPTLVLFVDHLDNNIALEGLVLMVIAVIVSIAAGFIKSESVSTSVIET